MLTAPQNEKTTASAIADPITTPAAPREIYMCRVGNLKAAGGSRKRRAGIVCVAGEAHTFTTLHELAGLLSCNDNNLSSRFVAACTEAGVDPDHNDGGFAFRYRGHLVTITGCGHGDPTVGSRKGPAGA